MDTVPYRRCTACHAVIEPGEQHWTLSQTPSRYAQDYCRSCVHVTAPLMRRTVLGELLEQHRQSGLKKRGRR
jgi:hypothetical protein